MKSASFRIVACAWIVWCVSGNCLAAGEIIHVATFNVENFLDVAVGTRRAKAPEAKAKVAEMILAARPDVIALQEMGSTNALLSLRATLKAGGLDFPHWEHITGHDTNIHVAVLSKFPFVAKSPHTNENFLLDGRRFQVSRGFAEVEIQVNPKYSFTLITAHLKSRRPVPEADEAEIREQEALKLRQLVEKRLASRPNLNLVVLGDFNDTKDSRSAKTLIGKGRASLFDTRPAERNGETRINSDAGPAARNVTWTYYYAKEDTYSRIDYILISNGLKREWLPEETYISTADWGAASDHRLIVAGFYAEEK